MKHKFSTLFPDTPEQDIRHVYSPYRVCPVGAHIDHQHGPVTGFALDHGVDFLYVPTETGVINLFSTDFEGQVLFPLTAIPPRYQHWGRYVQAAIYTLSKVGEIKYGVQGLICGSMPVGGLSSSSAVLLCYIMALADINDITVDEHQLIELAFIAEKEYIGLSLGKLDQSCEVLARKDHLLYLDTLDDSYRLIPKPDTMPDFDILVFFSGLTRTLVNTGYNTRTDECKVAAYSLLAYEGLPYGSFTDTRLRHVDRAVYNKWKHRLPEPLAKRATHFMTEHERVEQAVEAFSKGDINMLGAIMFASGDSSIQFWESGCPEMIALFQSIKEAPGVYGGRFSGAGFKGCCVALANPDHRQEAIDYVSKAYLEQFPEMEGKYEVWACKTADGVKRIS
ncbi:galactokinase/galacturonokinase [Mucilaginibacter yixingensis]|uniref:Galactokinase/galacturonokinase n=1 Tax=Mucilaginibacter yixingensis TaxID=1295612 RepID=A0A2T5JEB8_9SPHI|nr:galactokinase family protein [Mucilaginibacter yixingensis]PTR00777.1 galactokinase/galacturonokinase [Mucilaginibacter yixingensis]